MDGILTMLPSLKLTKDARTYEIMLSMNLTLRNFLEVKRLIAEMKETDVPLTIRALVTSIKAALRTTSVTDALEAFRELKVLWASEEQRSESSSQASRDIVYQLVELACKERQLHHFLPEFEGLPLTEEALNAMLVECIRLDNSEYARCIERLAKEQNAPLSETTYSLLIKAFMTDAAHARSIINEVSTSRNSHSPELVSAILAFCAKNSEWDFADRFFEDSKPQSISILSTFIRFYLDIGNPEKACDIYEQDVQALNTAGASGPFASTIGSRTERSLLNAAFRCGRTSLANKLLEASPCDVGKHISMIQSCASANNLDNAFSIFNSLERSGVDLNCVVYNAVLDACVQCRDFGAAEKWMEKSKQAGMADVVSYNTLIKACLMGNKISKARGLMDEMRGLGLQPNRVTYNELMNHVISGSGRKDELWSIVKEMKEAGLQPNQVTCSILLKFLNARSSEAEVAMTMDLIDTMDEQMDEVLLSSVVEACVRIGKPDLLARKLKEFQGSDRISVNGAHTFGSLIKAYGHAGDVDGVWRCWKEMRSRHIKPSSITLGCMVEAIIRNGDTDGAYDLIQQIEDDTQCQDAINSVIYCSLLKGFARERKLDRVWSVYKEMEKKRIDMSIVSYNTVIDACARVGRMDSVTGLLQDMKTRSVKPNLITFSTMIKGHSQAGDVQIAFALLDEMKRETNLKPDEILYNSLLDGCAQHGLVEEGLRLLEEMQTEGVAPSNFTLSVLVKLMNRARRLDQAFAKVKEISQKYKFKPNVHVYTNLVQACVSNRQLSRAMDTLQTMINEDVHPDSRTYTILVRASIANNLAEQAVALLRGALGLSGASPVVSQSMCANLDHALVNETLNGLVDRGCTQSLAVPLLNDVKACKQRVRVDATTQSRVMSNSMGQDKTWGVSMAKGKGRGSRNSA
jgi:pentatricopeptide repeat protein